MRTLRFVVLAVSVGALALPVWAQDVLTYTELKAKAPVALTRDDLQALMPGATMSRMNEKGSQHRWTNELNGEMIVSSDNRGGNGRPSTARGRWIVADDGRFCMVVQWRKGESEETCRFIVKASDGYYAVTEMDSEAHKAFKLSISR